MAVYGSWVESLFDSALAGATVKALLVTSAFEQDHSHETRSDLVDEISGSGYVAGGVAVPDVAFSMVDDGEVVLTCGEVDFGALSATDIAGIVFYIDTGNATTDVLVVADLFGPIDIEDFVSFAYQPPETGLIAATFA